MASLSFFTNVNPSSSASEEDSFEESTSSHSTTPGDCSKFSAASNCWLRWEDFLELIFCSKISSSASELVSSESTSSTNPGSSGWFLAAAKISSRVEPVDVKKE